MKMSLRILLFLIALYLTTMVKSVNDKVWFYGATVLGSVSTSVIMHALGITR